VIDYQSTYWIPLSSCSKEGLFLGYPMFAASDRLPEGSVNITGIVPDVLISKKESDPIRFIIITNAGKINGKFNIEKTLNKREIIYK
jgi:hypothetical protein